MFRKIKENTFGSKKVKDALKKYLPSDSTENLEDNGFFDFLLAKMLLYEST